MTRINTNVPSLVAQNRLQTSNKDLNTALTRLSTGLRINKGSDDPAGLIASEALRSEITSLNKSISNTRRASQIISTADSALGQVSSLLNDIRGLVVEAANNGALSSDEIAANQLQVDSSLEAINRIAQTTTFQGRKLLDGSLDFITSNGAGAAAIANLQIDQANLGATGSIAVTVNVATAATRAAVDITGFTASVAGTAATTSFDIGTVSAGTNATGLSVLGSPTPATAATATINIGTASVAATGTISYGTGATTAAAGTISYTNGGTAATGTATISSAATSATTGSLTLLAAGAPVTPTDATFNGLTIGTTTTGASFQIAFSDAGAVSSAPAISQSGNVITVTYDGAGAGTTTADIETALNAFSTTNSLGINITGTAAGNVTTVPSTLSFNGGTSGAAVTLNVTSPTGTASNAAAITFVNSGTATSNSAADIAVSVVSGGLQITYNGNFSIDAADVATAIAAQATGFTATGSGIAAPSATLTGGSFNSAGSASATLGTLSLTSETVGTGGNNVTVTLAQGGTAGANRSGNVITVTADFAGGAVDTDDIAALISNSTTTGFNATAATGAATVITSGSTSAGSTGSTGAAATTVGDFTLTPTTAGASGTSVGVTFTQSSGALVASRTGSGPIVITGNFAGASNASIIGAINSATLGFTASAGTLAGAATATSAASGTTGTGGADAVTVGEFTLTALNTAPTGGVNTVGTNGNNVGVTFTSGTGALVATRPGNTGNIVLTGDFSTATRADVLAAINANSNALGFVASTSTGQASGAPTGSVTVSGGTGTTGSNATNTGSIAVSSTAAAGSTSNVAINFSQGTTGSALTASRTGNGPITITGDFAAGTITGDDIAAAIRDNVTGFTAVATLGSTVQTNIPNTVTLAGGTPAGTTSPTIRINALNPGESSNVEVNYVNSTSATSVSAARTGTGPIVVTGNFTGGVTAASIANAISNQVAGFSASVVNAGTINAAPTADTELTGGTDATTVATINVIDTTTASASTAQIQFINSPGATGVAAQVDATNGNILVSYDSSTSVTAEDIATAINALEGYDASVEAGESGATVAGTLATGGTLGSGTGAVVGVADTPGGVQANVVFELAGKNGSEVFNVSAGTSLDQVVAQINLVSDATGVTAQGLGTTLQLRSSDFGSDALVDLRILSQATGGNFGTGSRDIGSDIVATVNGRAASGNGNRLSINTATLDLTADLTADFTGNASFTISGGGAQFQLGPEVVSNQQARVGIGSVNAARLGGIAGRLYELGSGEAASLAADPTRAARIVTQAIDQVTGLRGRLGAFQATTLESNLTSLNDTVSNLQEAESSIRDADFAQESAKLTRAQILVQSGTNVLSIANQNPQNVLSLLR